MPVIIFRFYYAYVWFSVRVMFTRINTLFKQLMAVLVNVSFQTYNYVSSSIRKESVVCLVAMIMLVGEELMAPYLTELNKGKVSFLVNFRIPC